MVALLSGLFAGFATTLVVIQCINALRRKLTPRLDEQTASDMMDAWAERRTSSTPSSTSQRRLPKRLAPLVSAGRMAARD